MPSKIPSYRPPGTPIKSDYGRTRQRLEDNRFYASAAWRRLRKLFLAEHPLCEECGKTGRSEEAVHVHHIKERKDYPDLSLDWDNLQSLCVRCHGMKRRRH